MSDLELIFTMLGEINKWHSVAETLLGWLVSKPKKSCKGGKTKRVNMWSV